MPYIVLFWSKMVTTSNSGRHIASRLEEASSNVFQTFIMTRLGSAEQQILHGNATIDGMCKEYDHCKLMIVTRNARRRF